METLVSAILLWLSVNFSLPADVDHPRIEFADPTHIATLHHGIENVASLHPDRMSTVVAGYIRDQNTVLLPTGWTGGDAAELSVLVHELVHHLQEVADLRYECPQAREALAYKAQDAWLGLFGSDLFQAFGIDPFTRLVRTSCGY